MLNFVFPNLFRECGVQTREEFEKEMKNLADNADVQQAYSELLMAEQTHTQLVEEVSRSRKDLCTF